MKKIIFLFFCFTLSISCVSAISLKGNSIITCNGKDYGYHNKHYYEAYNNNGQWYSKGSTLGTDNPCNDVVTFDECVDGDTAKFKFKSREITVRFLAVDTPETKHPTKGSEPYGKEASNFTCKALKKAKKIELEYDSNSDKTDKYGRSLAWVFVDGSLLQAKLVKNGLAKVAYLYDDYKYTEKLEKLEEEAQNKKVGIWSSEDPEIDVAQVVIDIITDFVEDFIRKLFNQIS